MPTHVVTLKSEAEDFALKNQDQQVSPSGKHSYPRLVEGGDSRV